jgi:hypothetical protein
MLMKTIHDLSMRFDILLLISVRFFRPTPSSKAETISQHCARRADPGHRPPTGALRPPVFRQLPGAQQVYEQARARTQHRAEEQIGSPLLHPVLLAHAAIVGIARIQFGR